MEYTDADESPRGKHTTHILCSVNFDNRAVHAIMWNKFVKPDRSQMTIPYGACCIPKVTNTHSVYVIVIFFHGTDVYVKASEYYVIRTLSVVF
jgi:hypothetical protein